MHLKSLLRLLIFAAVFAGCQRGNVDQDGNPFEGVIIGNQEWMAENLNVATFRNGDPIPEVKSAEEWVKAGETGQPAWCFFNNDPANGKKFGRLYNWYAAVDERGIAPEGWHVPSDDEWTQLAEATGGTIQAGTNLKAKSGWTQGNGNDKYGMNILAAGGRGGVSGFTGQGTVAVFWSATSKSRSFGWYRVLHAQRTGVFQESDDKMSGFSVRCVKDAD